MTAAFSPAFEVATMWAQRPIVEKHNSYAFYHPIAEGVASMICDLPFKLVNSFMFHIPIYFMTNLRRTADAFFAYWFFTFVTVLTMSMAFRMIGSLSRTLGQSMPPCSTIVVIAIICTGFAILLSYMVPWLGWFRWISPVLYTNLPILIAMMIAFCAIHLCAAEFIPTKRSRGEILLFPRGHSKSTYNRPNAEEDANYQFFTQDIGTESSAIALREYRVLSSGKDPVETFQRQSAVFHWGNLNYDIKTKDGSDDLQGWVKPGTLTALMGVTGAGKTSLLDVLADRIATGVATGDVYIDGELRDATFGRRIGYVQQEDIHLPTTTVREALQFSAVPRQSKGKTKGEKLSYVDTVLDMLDMEAYADAVVCVPGEGLNVEQRKRLTIAVELVARPDLLLFLDEPTSGLDSQTAWSICMLLRKLADSRQTVPCTTHQPSSQLFQMFDSLLLLNMGRTQLYFGPIGPNASTLIGYFERNSAEKCPVGANPAEWIVEATRTQTETEEQLTEDENHGFVEKWNDSQEKMELFPSVDQQIIPRFTDGRTLFEARERRNRSYSWVVFVSSNVIVELCWQTLVGVLVCITTLSQAVAAGVELPETANPRVPKCPAGLLGLQYRASPLTYLSNGLILGGLGNTRISCSPKELLRIEVLPAGFDTCGDYLAEVARSANGYVENPEATGSCSYCPIAEVNSFLGGLGMNTSDP
ncbi:P-loop containing nucleoside triphosphate hydrolase protein [Hypoxylon sp. FL1150]|nr:P-loop containing nucleoside triphosphate hydrolase protein [Hypoxylon sp. FL1150]